MRAFELALEEGADALELDVRVSADGVPVVIHDPSLARTAGIQALIAELPRRAFSGLMRAPASQPMRVAPFRCANRGFASRCSPRCCRHFPRCRSIIEIKTSAASEAVRRTLLEQRAAERAVLMSFEPAALELFHEPPWLTGATGSDTQQLIRRAIMRREPGAASYAALSLPERFHGVPLPIDLIARTARRMGKPVHIWPIDSPERARRLWRKGVSGIVTNYPSEIRAVRDEG